MSLSIDSAVLLRFERSAHIGTGRSEGPIDRAVRRDAEGEPYVPGSALKGALRMTAERLVQQLNEITDLGPEVQLGMRRRGDRVLEERCRAPRPEQMCQSHDPCVVCRLFGNVFTGSRLRVSDAHAQEDSPLDRSLRDLADREDGGDLLRGPQARTAPTDVLTRLRIDRRRKGAEAGALFTSEYSRKASAYRASLTGTLPTVPLSDANERPAELVLLAAAVSATDQIGGEASTGHGRCRLQFTGSGTISASRGKTSGADKESSTSSGNAENSAVSEESLTSTDGSAYALDALLDEQSLRALAWHRFVN
jgi:CRISPR/Cas system CSM-associated protein Csm3 (group 7 of RAMP superfamily)